MPVIDDPKSFAAALVKKAAAKPSEKKPVGAAPYGGDEMDAEDGGEEGGETAAARAMMGALEAGDPKAFAAGMRDFIRICYPGMMSGEE